VHALEHLQITRCGLRGQPAQGGSVTSPLTCYTTRGSLFLANALSNQVHDKAGVTGIVPVYARMIFRSLLWLTAAIVEQCAERSPAPQVPLESVTIEVLSTVNRLSKTHLHIEAPLAEGYSTFLPRSHSSSAIPRIL